MPDDMREEMMTREHGGRGHACFKRTPNCNRWQQERERGMWQEEGGRCGTGALLSSPLRLSAYLLSRQSVGPLQHLSPAAFLRPVSRGHFTADRLMCLHEPPPLHMVEEDRIMESEKRKEPEIGKGIMIN